MFKDRNLDVSFNDQESSLNTSGKKRTLSETIEDELLGGTPIEIPNNDDSNEPELKRRNQNQTSDNDENEEVVNFHSSLDSFLIVCNEID